MKRFDLIDGMRGYFLVFMLINHLVFAGGLWLMEINHRQLAFVEDAQGFVFLSGLLIGMVYARKMMKYGYEQGRDLIWARALELYKCNGPRHCGPVCSHGHPACAIHLVQLARHDIV